MTREGQIPPFQPLQLTERSIVFLTIHLQIFLAEVVVNVLGNTATALQRKNLALGRQSRIVQAVVRKDDIGKFAHQGVVLYAHLLSETFKKEIERHI
jgi:hypothetical protein